MTTATKPRYRLEGYDLVNRKWSWSVVSADGVHENCILDSEEEAVGALEDLKAIYASGDPDFDPETVRYVAIA